VSVIIKKRYADFSDCGIYRYNLGRVWDYNKPRMLIVMLNPSTANVEKDDPTTRKCLKYARDNNCGSYVAVNLFAFCSPKPEVMKSFCDPIGVETDEKLLKELEELKEIKNSILVAAWGNHGSFLDRDFAVYKIGIESGYEWLCFGTNKNGSPKHPTYLPHGLEFKKYIMEKENEN